MTAAAAPRAFVVWFRDLDRWNVGSYIATGWRWPKDAIRPLADALKRKTLDVDRKSTPPDALRLVTLHFDGEMEPRSEASRPVKGRLFWAVPGDVTYSKIDVRNGAIGIVPPEMGRVCVTTEYPVYAVNPEVADARYVKLLFRTAVFRKKINGMISGASGRKRVQPDELEGLEVPLPALEAQAVIIAAWEAAQREIAATRAKIAALEARIEADFLTDLGLTVPVRAALPKFFAVRWKDFWRWGVQPNQLAVVSIDVSRGKYPPVRGFECLSEVKHGCSASPSPKPTGLDVLKISAVTRGEFRPEERKHAFDRPRFRREFELKAGDVLMCRTNGTLRLVGMSAMVESDMPDLIYPDKVIRVRARDNLLPAYLWRVVQAPFVRSQIEYAARTAVGNYAIGSDDILNLEFPLPPLNVQRRMIARVEAARSKIATLRAAAAEREQQAKADVEAMILGTKPVGAD